MLFRDTNVNIENKANYLTTFVNFKTSLRYTTQAVNSATLYFRTGTVESSNFEPNRHYVKLQDTDYRLHDSLDDSEFGNMKITLMIDSFYEKVTAEYWEFLIVASSVGGLFATFYKLT